MGRSPCYENVGLKKGPWTSEEDQKLSAYIEEHGHGSWSALPAKAGLQRCGKSCRLRWTNYLRPDIKRGKFSFQEEQTILQLHALIGNRWSVMATHLPQRTDNEIKNHWNTHLKKRLAKMGIDPMTHKPKMDANSKDAANRSHMAQWENARLEAEARSVRESKLAFNPLQNQLGSSASADQLLDKAAAPLMQPCLDVLRACQGLPWSKTAKNDFTFPGGGDLESPVPTLNFTVKTLAVPTVGLGSNSAMEYSGVCEGGIGKSNHWSEDNERMDNRRALHGLTYSSEGIRVNENVPISNFMDHMLQNVDNWKSFEGGESSNNGIGSYGGDISGLSKEIVVAQGHDSRPSTLKQKNLLVGDLITTGV
ncbi:hypothetical protein L1049_005681 [Liquidambar formosana]|uniref:Uncharacterized protein n=1 Tax=Liquidambar formosana TaxID=63359 RepID=A0AAP0RE65_LIQFO